jgi:CRP/FNR family transcriptional regulator
VNAVQKLQCQFCAVRKNSFCAAFDAGALLQHQASGRAISYAANAVLFREADPVAGVYNITSGVVRLVRSTASGRRRVLGFAIPGDFVGTVEDDRHRYSAETAGPVTACVFSQDAFWNRIEAEARSSRAVYGASTRRLDLALDHISLLGRPDAEGRVAGFIDNFLARWRRVGHEGSRVPMPMTRLDLADHLGLTLSTVSRTLHRLQAQ